MADFLANFTGSGLLSAHTTDSGHTNTAGTAFSLSPSGNLYHTGSTLVDPEFDGLSLPPAGDRDLIVRFYHASSANAACGVTFCSTGTGVGYLMQLQGTTPASVSLWKLGGTSSGFIATIFPEQLVDPANYSVFYKAEIRDADIKIYTSSAVDGTYTLRYTYADTEHRGTSLRIRAANTASSTTGKHIDYLSLAEVVTPPADPPPFPDGTYDVSWSANGGADTATSKMYVADIFEYASPTFALRSKAISSEPASLVHGVDADFNAIGFAATPTTGNTTLTNGSVVLTPSAVTPVSGIEYTITFPISRLDKQEASYVWTLDINGETSDTSSLAYTIDGNASDEFYGTVSALTGVWAEAEYSALEVGDNIYAIRTAGTGTPDVTVGAFPEDTTWTIYIQDVNDDAWGSSGTLTVPAADTTAPVITLLGSSTVTHAQQATYTDAGATASDDIDGDITADIVTVNPVDVNTVGSYTITYDVDDGAGNSATQVTRTVNVTDQEAPTITLTGSATVNHAHGTTYTDAGATASDFNDGDVTADIVVSGDTVNTSTLGSYTILYDVDDAAGNSATQVSRTVNVTDQTAPVITLTGNATVNLTVGDTYTEQGATWADAIDGSGSATVGGDTVDTSTAATYTVTYNFTDTAGNAATQVTRSVVVSAADVVPTQFDLGSDVTGAERSTATQRTFTIAGIDSGQTVSITATGSATVSPATGELGDTVTVTLVSSGSFAAMLSGGATINGVSDSFSITTRAQIVPTVSTQPTNQSVTEGQTATFTVAFTNASSIQWYDASDDSAISGATGTSLAVNTVLADDGNTYYAIATSNDSATVQTSTVTLSVAASTATQAPVIDTGGSTSITLTVGDTYSDPAWTATDDIGSVDVDFTGTVDTSTAGTYTRNGSATNPIGSDIEIYTVTVEEAAEGIEIVPTPIYIYVSVNADTNIKEYGVYASNTWRATVDFAAPASQVTGDVVSVAWSVARGTSITLGDSVLSGNITQTELIAGDDSGEALILCTATFANEVVSDYFLINVVDPTDTAGVWEIQ